jgi:HlyD family secretion protein
MEAVVEVDETDIPDIAVGDSTSVEIDAFPNQRFSGVVTKIGNSSIVPRQPSVAGSNQAIDFEVRITLDDPPTAVRPDLSATADIITDTRSGVLAIPITALTLMDADDFERVPNENVAESEQPFDQEGDVEGVFIADDGVAHFRPVRIGIAGENYFEVLSGLEEGQTVVSGSFQAIRDLEDGGRIRVTAADTTESTTRGAAGG